MRKEVLRQEQVIRTIKRMTHEIIERNIDLDHIVFVGILNKGLPLAERIQSYMKHFTHKDLPVYGLNIVAYRDDSKKASISKEDNIFDITDKHVILVDDVLYTGRSVRAAMDALIKHGRPKSIQLAILIDRGHRELPIRADFIGKNIPTSHSENIFVDMEKLEVYIESKNP